MEVIKARKFCNDKKEILKKYPKSQDEIDDYLKEVIKEPNSGKIYPGLENARKKRFSITTYKISKKNGLRLIYIYKPERDKKQQGLHLYTCIGKN